MWMCNTNIIIMIQTIKGLSWTSTFPVLPLRRYAFLLMDVRYDINCQFVCHKITIL